MYPDPIPAPPPVRKGGFWRAALRVVAMLLLLGVVFAAGAVVGTRFIDRPISFPAIVSSPSKTSRLVNEVHDILSQQALRPSSEDSMAAGAVTGLVRSLDDTYAAYFDPKSLTLFEEETNGQFFGIGITISVNNGKPVVIQPLKDTPAARAGIKAGDEIVSVDGVTKPKWTSDEIVSKIRGPEGTKVVLGIRHKDSKDVVILTITRAKIDTPNVMSEMVGSDVGYLRLLSFNARASDELRAQIQQLEAKGAQGFVLDLRENPGGLLDAGVNATSLFVKQGPIVRVDRRNQPEKVYNATGGFMTEKPLVVLVDGNSASAAEIMAGALQDYGRGTLVGEKTFGKGSVQTVADLASGGAVKFTIAHYLTPKKRAINGVGLQPDIVVKMDPALQAGAGHKTDTQFQKAVETLKLKMAH